MNKATKTIIIPPGSSERFVDLSTFGGGEYFGRNIFMTAICSYPSGYRIVYPCSSRHMVVFCYEGEFCWQCDQERGTLTAGSVLIHPAGRYQEISSSCACKSIFFLLTPSPAWGSPELSCSPAADSELIRQLMLKAEKLSISSDNSGKNAVGKLLFLLLKSVIHSPGSDPHPMQMLHSRMLLQPQKAWNIESMAKFCGVSVPHFFLLWERNYHVSPYQMLIDIRLEQAKELLAQTAYPVKNIATLCGYEHPFSLTRAFRKKYGVTPEKYRNSVVKKCKS